MEDEPTGAPPQAPESLLPYDLWTEEALRQVVVMAIGYAAENGLPGEHHFFISFRTDARGVSVPTRLLAQYPHEMTIVLQHQFWDLKLEDGGQRFSVGLSFGGVPSSLSVPLSAVTGFADPHVQFGLRFRPPEEHPANDEAADRAAPPEETAAAEPEGEEEPADPANQVVSLDAFRRRPPAKD
ncbi:MAG: ClpXP protease specificity-enhancing factor SspB [Acetobacteraceae bacterium]|nr:ClpXP protease specificity-enhancing factor SspB [Acetobacteraceae bacterium]